MTIPTISTLPVAPARTDAPATFVTRADAFLAAMVVMQGELNTSIGAMNTDIAGVNADAIAAAASATAAANASNASVWVSGTTYALGDVVYSPVDYQSYRRIIAGAGATDPSSDGTNWTKISAEPLPTQTGQSGNYLTTDGTNASWAEVYPSQSGNDGKFLTTDGTNTSWGDVPSGTYEFTASGSITAGDTVALNDDDTVSTIFTSGAAGEVGTGVQWRSSSFNYASISYGSNTDSYAYFGGGSSLFGCSVVNVSGVTVSTSGFAGISSSYTVQNLTADYSVAHDRHLAFFTNQSASDQGVVFVGRDDGSVLNTGTFTSFPLRVDNQDVIYDPTSEKFIAIYKDLTTSGHFQVRTITTNSSDNSVSFGSAQTVTTTTSGTNQSNLCYDPDSTKVLAAYRADARLRFKVLTISGTSISLGSEVLLAASVIEPSNSSFYNATTVYDTVNSRFVVSYRTDAGYLEVAYGTLSGTTTTWSTPVRVSETQINYFNRGSYNPATDQLDVFVVDSTGSNYSWAIDISTATPTVSKTANLFAISTSEDKSDIIYDSTNDVNVLMLNNYAQAQKVDSLFENASRFYGLAASSAADGQTVELNLESSTNENQSGLSINQGYWVALNGSLSTTDTGYPFVGYGVAADKLFLSHLPVQTGNAGKFLTTDGTSTSWVGTGNWELISTTTASGASTIDIEDFSANYEAFKIVFRLSSSSAINAFRVQLNIGGTYRTSSYKYLGVVIDRNNGTTYTTTSGGNSAYINVFEGLTLYNDQPFFGELTFPDVNSLVRHVMSYDFTTVQNSNEPYRNIGVGHYPSLSGSTLSGARLSLNTGTLDGTVLFYGLIS